MKTHHKRNLPGLLAIALLFTLSFISCNKEGFDNNNVDPQYSTTGNASGAQQNPPLITSGSGTMTGVFNARTNNWEYVINWSSLTGLATAVEIRGPASVGVNGGLQLALTITNNGINGNASGTVTLTEEQQANLLAGLFYYTITTATNISGEIRGQISAELVHN